MELGVLHISVFYSPHKTKAKEMKMLPDHWMLFPVTADKLRHLQSCPREALKPYNHSFKSNNLNVTYTPKEEKTPLTSINLYPQRYYSADYPGKKKRVCLISDSNISQMKRNI